MKWLTKLFDRYKMLSQPAKASLWFMFSSVVTRGISLITTPLFARVLTKEEYGITGIYNTWLTIITIIATFELATGVFNKAMIKFEKDRDGYTSSTLFLASLITCFVFFIYFLDSTTWNQLTGLNTHLMVMMFIDIFFSSAWSFYSIRKRFDFQYISIVIVTIVANLLATIVSVLLVIYYPENRVEAKMFGSLVVRVIIYAYFYVSLLKTGRTLINREYWVYSLRYNCPLIPHYLSQQILSQSDRIMISRMCGNADAGLYTLSYQLAITMQIITNAIHASFMPWMFQRLKAGDVNNIGKRALQIEIVVGAICVLFSLFGPELILILGGAEYSSAVYVIPPVAMSILFLTIYSFIGNIEFYYEKTKFVMIASCTIALVNIVLNYIFINLFGYLAAGYTTLFCYFAYSIIHYWFMKRICLKEGIQNPFFEKSMWITAIIYAVISLLVSFVYDKSWIRYLFIGLVSSVGILYYKKHKATIIHGEDGNEEIGKNRS